MLFQLTFTARAVPIRVGDHGPLRPPRRGAARPPQPLGGCGHQPDPVGPPGRLHLRPGQGLYSGGRRSLSLPPRPPSRPPSRGSGFRCRSVPQPGGKHQGRGARREISSGGVPRELPAALRPCKPQPASRRAPVSEHRFPP